MASIRNRNGRYTVTWRDEHGKLRGLTFGGEREAKWLVRELNRF
jgi:hypothetical protein